MITLALMDRFGLSEAEVRRQIEAQNEAVALHAKRLLIDLPKRGGA
jgi:hypothetical protein